MAERDSTHLSLVIPAYNEERRLPRTLREVSEYLEGTGLSYELVVVDDGSGDRTSEVTQRLGLQGGQLRLLSNGENRGKGYSVRRGMMAAAGTFVFYSDADLSTPIEELGRLLSYLEQGADIVVGSRGMRESQLDVRQPKYRESMGRIFNWLVRILVLPGFKDTQCGFKGFRRECVREIFQRQRLDKFAFDVEVLHIARRLGLHVVEVPIRWINSPESRVNVVGDAWRMMVDLLRIRLYGLMGQYN